MVGPTQPIAWVSPLPQHKSDHAVDSNTMGIDPREGPEGLRVKSCQAKGFKGGGVEKKTLSMALLGGF